MKYPKNELAQTLIASCIANHVKDVVISPGSRNAPLTIGFSKTPAVDTYSIVDERCAAFVALGMAQKTQKVTAVVCTSGSAMLNYYPAVAEAFYANIPIIIITADRPKHLIDVGDGQTIRQEGVFKNHILFEANLVAIKNHLDKENNKRLIYKAIKIAHNQKGPVHINVPFDEPLYQLTEELMAYPPEDLQKSKLLQKQPLASTALTSFANIWNQATKKIVLVGVHQPNELLQTQINHLLKDPSVLVLTETTSNLNHQYVINSIDQFLVALTEDDKAFFKPDVLVTIGGMVVSKRIKQYLRAFKPQHHWVVHPTTGYDTFFAKTHHFKQPATVFFSQFFKLTKNIESSYQQKGLSVKTNRKKQHQQFVVKATHSDFKVFDFINQSLPLSSVLQLSNSATIRYAQLFDIDDSISVFCNRGTSGIDGSTATAIGYAMQTKKQVVLVTGDLSFLYDSNALWNAYVPSNFRMIVVHNNGGGIFKILPGPQKTDALPYFETPHGLTAKHLSKMYGFEYKTAKTNWQLKSVLKAFYKKSKRPKILEVFTPSDINNTVLDMYFKSFKL